MGLVFRSKDLTIYEPEINFNPNGCGDRISDNKGNPYWTDERLRILADTNLTLEEETGYRFPVGTQSLRNLANAEFAHEYT